MAEKYIFFGDQGLIVKYPVQAVEVIDFAFPDDQGKKFIIDSIATLEISYDDRKQLFSVTEAGNTIGSDLDQTDLALLLLSRTSYSLAKSINSGIAVKGAAVHRNGNTLLMPGKNGLGKSLLTTWLLEHGYTFLTDEAVCFPEQSTDIEALNRPIHFKKTAFDKIKHFPQLQTPGKGILQNKNNLLFSHTIFKDKTVNNSTQLSVLLFIKYNAGTELAIENISPALAAQRLMGCVVNGKNLKLHGFQQVAALTRKIPAITLQYSNFDQIEGILEPVIDFIFNTGCAPATLNQFIKAFHQLTAKPTNTVSANKADMLADETTPSPTFPIQEATPKRKKRKMTIGMATYDDYDGVYFSVQALRMYHPEIINECEILVIDNHPDGPCAENLKNIDQSIDSYRYLPLQDVQGTAVRDFIFQHAVGDYIISMDCHVFLLPGVLKKLFDYFEANPDCNDLLQGPMIHDDLKSFSTHFVPEWGGGMYGKWGHDKRAEDVDGAGFDIPMQGLGFFACRRKAWPGFNPRFYGFGGEEGYIHEKFRQAGGRSLCLPFLRWLHRFARPMGVPYSVQWKDRIHNYLVGFTELGLDTQPVKEHFIELLGKEPATVLFQEIETEITSPFDHFDAIYCITLDQESEYWKEMQKRFQSLGIDKRVRTFKAIETPENQHIGNALAHRAIIRQAKQQKLNNVLVFEENTLFLDKTLHHLATSITELKEQQNWNIFYLGGYKWGGNYANTEGCSNLQRPYGLTCSYSLAYNNSVYDPILSELPETIDEMSLWVKENYALDRYLRRLNGLLLASPVISSQNELLAQENKEFHNRFTL